MPDIQECLFNSKVKLTAIQIDNILKNENKGLSISNVYAGLERLRERGHEEICFKQIRIKKKPKPVFVYWMNAKQKRDYFKRRALKYE